MFLNGFTPGAVIKTKLLFITKQTIIHLEVLQNLQGQFRGTHFLIDSLKLFKLFNFLYSSGILSKSEEDNVSK